MPAIEVFLPMPPTTNNLFDSFLDPRTHKLRRVKSKTYVRWTEHAGRAPLAGQWQRITEREDNRIAWVLHLTVYGLPPNADLSNRAKAPEDLICAMTGLRDCNTKRITMEREPPHERLGKCVKVWAVTVTMEDE